MGPASTKSQVQKGGFKKRDKHKRDNMNPRGREISITVLSFFFFKFWHPFLVIKIMMQIKISPKTHFAPFVPMIFFNHVIITSSPFSIPSFFPVCLADVQVPVLEQSYSLDHFDCVSRSIDPAFNSLIVIAIHRHLAYYFNSCLTTLL